jgi:hypothetical protein
MEQERSACAVDIVSWTRRVLDWLRCFLGECEGQTQKLIKKSAKNEGVCVGFAANPTDVVDTMSLWRVRRSRQESFLGGLCVNKIGPSV